VHVMGDDIKVDAKTWLILRKERWWGSGLAGVRVLSNQLI
jgi:hypothetical protein